MNNVYDEKLYEYNPLKVKEKMRAFPNLKFPLRFCAWTMEDAVAHVKYWYDDGVTEGEITELGADEYMRYANKVSRDGKKLNRAEPLPTSD